MHQGDTAPPDIEGQLDAASLLCQRQVHELYDQALPDETRRYRLITIVSDFAARVRRIALEAGSKS